MATMKIIRKYLRRILPEKLVHALRAVKSPYLVPKKFKPRLERYVSVWNSAYSQDDEYLSDREADFAQLRAYVHRVDKSLERDDWQCGHGIEEYNVVRKLLAKYSEVNCDTLNWAFDIVREYERRQLDEKSGRHSTSQVDPQQTLSPKAILNFLKNRRSCRFYLEKEVPRSNVENIVQAALESPWSCNRQALRVYATVNPKLTLETLQCFNGFTGFSRFVPCAMVFCVNLRCYTLPNELFVPHLDAGLSAENAALMASTLGLSMTFLSWGSRNPASEAQLRSLLNIPDYYEIVVGVACGYPCKNIKRPARKSVAETLIMYE